MKALDLITFFDVQGNMAKGKVLFDGAPSDLTPEHMRHIYGVDGEDDELAQALAQSHLGRPRELWLEATRFAEAPDANPGLG